MLEEYLSPSQAAEESGLDYATLLARVRRGTVPAVKIGHLILIHKDTLPKVKPLMFRSDKRKGRSPEVNKIYRRWQQIKQRCYNPSCPGYENYGGRGIEMCRQWLLSFEEFYEYVQKLPKPEGKRLSLDRIDNDGNYEPGNVRWATPTVQNNNTRRQSR